MSLNYICAFGCFICGSIYYFNSFRSRGLMDKVDAVVYYAVALLIIWGVTNEP